MADLLHGRFVWSELMTPDPKSAETFYSKVVGWTTEPFPGMAGAPYTVWKAGEQGVGGMMALTGDMKAAGVPAHWMSYVGVRDAKATVARAESLGAKVEVPPQPIPQVGTFAVLADPQGAHIAILQPDGPEPGGPEGDPAAREFSWRELATSDLAGAKAFYSSLFGWDMLEAHDMGPLGIYQEFGRFGRPLGGMYTKPASMPAPPHWLVYARVPDLEKAIAAVRAGGGQVLHGPEEVPGGSLIAQCLDPQGAAFALHEVRG